MEPNKSIIYLLPATLHDEALHTIPAYVTDAVKACTVFFTENERTARRYLKKLVKDLVIDDHQWFSIHKAEQQVRDLFRQKIREGNCIGIISEAGSPCVADPGQMLVAVAQEEQVPVKPLVGPNSILLALMASGMNGQRFQFTGYLPVKEHDRVKMIRELEAESRKKSCTQIFIETPYRNDQLVEALLKNCQPSTRLCIAAELTAAEEWIKTKSIKEWAQHKPILHKKQAIFLLYAGQ
jgi:16S rRNA (cytidine1402-2'-O)-methyltransferase